MNSGDNVRRFDGGFRTGFAEWPCRRLCAARPLDACPPLDLDRLLGVGVVNVVITLTPCRHNRAADGFGFANDMEILHFVRCKVDPTGPLLLGCITGEDAVIWWVNPEWGAEPVEFELTAVEARLVHRQYQEQQQDIAKWDAVEHRTIADENALDEALNRDVFAGTRFGRPVSQEVP